MKNKKENGLEMLVNLLADIGSVAAKVASYVFHWVVFSYGWLLILIWWYCGFFWLLLAIFIYYAFKEAAK